jgi:hypothetical protein
VQRRLVAERDGGVCAMCGTDTEKLRTEYRNALFAACWGDRPPSFVPRAGTVESIVKGQPDAPKRPAGFPSPDRSWWEADHIVPVVEGGGECDLSNFRTLCCPCHKKVTAELARRRAKQRRQQKQPELSLS